MKNFLMATLLASVAVAGVFVDSAEARRRSKYSSRGFDETTVLSTYSIYDRLSDETPIVDATINEFGIDTDPNSGLFVGAIEDYFKYSNSDLDPIGGDDGINEDQFIDNEIDILDLFEDAEGTVNLIPEISIDRQETVANLKAELVKAEDVPKNLEFQEDDVIKYSIVTQSNEEIEVLGWLNFKDFLNVTEQIDFTSNPDFSSELPLDFQRNQAINDLSYILENNLLIQAVNPRTIPENQDENEGLVPTTRFEQLVEEESEIVSTPENNGNITLLALGALGVFLTLKHKKKYI